MKQLTETLFPKVEFSKTEVNLIAQALNQPYMQKYLKNLAAESIKAIVHSMPAVLDNGSMEPTESYLRRVSEVKGGLVAIETLLAIEPAPQD